MEPSIYFDVGEEFQKLFNLVVELRLVKGGMP